MPIQLDKILENIANEFVLHPNNTGNVSKREVDDAWTRVGRNNKLSVHESRSIFKVLQKKYEQEKVKGNSAWKLFGLMQQIHQPTEAKASIKEEEEALPIDEVEEYEMLEVQEPDDEEEEVENTAGSGSRFAQQPRGHSTGSASDGDSPTKSVQSSAGVTPEKDEKPVIKTHVATPRPPANTNNEDKKVLLNSLAHANTARQTSQSPASAVTAAALQKKGITVKKAPNATTAKLASSGHHNSGVHKSATQRNTIQLPESLKRKLSEDLPLMPAQAKKVHFTDKTNPKQPPSSNANIASAATNAAAIASAQLIQLKNVKQEREREPATYASPHGINIITVPGANVVGDAEVAAGSSTIGSNTSTANGYATNLQEVNFSNEIIFDAGGTVNGANNLVGKNTKSTTTTATTVNTNDIINLGNFDNSLPPTFFKNLCNSTRHEALGLYVSNIMNRLSARIAAKLEISIVRAILDAQSEELED